MTADESRLGPRDRLFLWTCLAVAALSLALGLYLYPRVNPEASIQFEVTQDESQSIAESLAAELGISLEDDTHASRFDYDNSTKVFLERTLGLEETNALVTGPIRMWRWSHRWFQPLRKEEFRADVTTTGALAGFEHVVEEDGAGARLSVDEARAKAETFLEDVLSRSRAGSSGLSARVASLEFLEAQTTERKGRTDHSFVWRDPQVRLGDGDCRYEVRIQGDEVGAFRQFVHLPEAWERDYQGLRSKNQSASLVASFLLFLTMIAAVVVFLRRIRQRDIRWRLALAFGSVGAVLTFLGQLNLYSMILFGFDTTQSWGGFFVSSAFLLLQSSVGVGLLIFLLTASGDALYREHYPDKVAPQALFTPRGFRTKRFLLQSVLGFTLTACFFLFQELFYLVAERFGAWAPSDVPYTDLLGTAVPFVFLVLVGFQPAVVEEFLSRMFSIPLLQRLTKRTWIAVLVPAFIWGFAHSNYPNQPFFIRGLEVGFVGIVVGIVMLRFGILATLVWHYMVDALYSGIFLLRSGEPYYVASAVVAGGVVLLPLIYSLVSYARRGAFEDPEPLLSRRVPGPQEPDWIPDIEDVPLPPPSWPMRRRVALFGIGAAVLFVALLIPGASLQRDDALTLGPVEARSRADEFASRLIGPIDSLKVAVVGGADPASQWVEYAAETAGFDAAREAVALHRADFRWTFRYFRPLDPEELTVTIDGGTGELVRLSRHLDEKAERTTLGSDEARVRALGFLVARGIPTSRLELRESSSENRPNRLDHTFVWETRDGDPWNVGEARYRVEVVVQGDEVGEFQRSLHVPESWLRERDKTTLGSGGRLLLLTMSLGLLLGLVAWLVFDGHRRGVTRWRRAVIFAIPFGLVAVLARVNGMPDSLMKYDTALPWNQFLLFAGGLLALVTTFFFGMQVLAGGVLGTLFPDVWHFRRHEHRSAATWDALAAGVAGLGLVVLVSRIVGYFGQIWPAYLPPELEGPRISSFQPWFQIVASVASRWLLDVTLFSAAVRLVQLGRVQWRVWGLIAGLVVAIPSVSHGIGGWAVGLLPVLVVGGAGAVFTVFVGRRNRLAYAVGLWFGLVAERVAPFLGGSGLYFQMQGGIALAVLLLPVLWLALTATVRSQAIGTPTSSSR
ncbi:MAG: CPBP family intramembrane metalloprotease [Candidatus Eisenbacteria bacterium]|uniref:CPBP family intramembrane metalloprotease n=1 Tax=Eiseniibacteriota bacterium TaxID=2212470 RepID=A0A956N9L1_UNCEI|nr:CPBP family intramembrane metalloprotease [Candidatus Eisenbacteria bacterium]MCB9463293.1 CPBP family intramembrane metalloprotease [Candidatus Eisenbacteria bacterium]